MKILEIIFWILIGIIFYTYLGYGIVLFLLIRIKRFFSKKELFQVNETDLPEVTLLIAAYNEQDYVKAKIENTLQLNYPAEKLHQIWVTDGSTDKTPEILAAYPAVEVLHKPERNGKIAAMNRAIKFVKTPIVIFSDANTLLGKESIIKIAGMFSNLNTGCVSGEKRIMNDDKEAASAAGEGIYWKYESTLKKWDAEFYSAVGAAGELFAIRTELFNEVEPDTLLDDFIISLRVAMKGYKIDYDPEAYAIETASANVKEELKRKIRIAAGGIQSVALFLVLVLNIFLIPVSELYPVIMALQILFYLSAFTGWILENKKLKVKIFFIPYYFFIMNYAVFMGFGRYIRNTQSVNWERARRA